MIIYPDNPEYAQCLDWTRAHVEKLREEINRYLPEIEKMKTMLILEKISKIKIG